MKKVIALTLIMLISGCATGYHKNGLTGGYKELAYDDNVFGVAFGGNSYTSSQRVEDLALLRCANLTLKNGFKYFIVSDKLEGKQWFNTKSTVNILIQCFHEKPAEEGITVYDAAQLRKLLLDKYGLSGDVERE